MTDFRPPGFADVEAAGRRLDGRVVRTPLLELPLLNERIGGRLLIKAEMLQRTGSFKFRGALNFLDRLKPEDRRRGVVAFSSGNHAQGVAAAARLLGVSATIVMPSDAPAVKLEGTRAQGAEVRLYDRWREDREELAKAIATERGASLVPPFDHPWTIAGQGTAGLEMFRQAAERGLRLDAVLVPCSGGGLVSGIALALSETSPETAIYSVEPTGFDDTARSLATGRPVANPPGGRSICDALLSERPGVLTFAIMERLLSGGLAVDDRWTQEAMAVAFSDLKLVAEPGGATALAAVLSGVFEARGRTVAVVCSGGNVDPETFSAALGSARHGHGSARPGRNGS